MTILTSSQIKKLTRLFADNVHQLLLTSLADTCTSKEFTSISHALTAAQSFYQLSYQDSKFKVEGDINSLTPCECKQELCKHACSHVIGCTERKFYMQMIHPILWTNLADCPFVKECLQYSGNKGIVLNIVHVNTHKVNWEGMLSKRPRLFLLCPLSKNVTSNL